MPVVNNVTRMLDAKKVPYRAFETPIEKLGAEETARILGVNLDVVFKTIVVLRQKPGAKPVLAVVPGSDEVNLKLVASALGEKKVQLPSEKEAETLTGLQSGGISPLALINRGFHVVIDESAKSHAEIHVSGGQRGLNICIPVNALAKLTNARFAQISTATTDKK